MAGLWQRIQGLFRPSGGAPPTPAPGSVEIDDVGVRRWLEHGKSESVRWDELTRVELITTDEGPLVEDVFWLLFGDDGKGCVLPGMTVEGDVLARLQALPGFDNEALIRSVSSTENARFLLWKRGG
jgi:hypothetical protein